MLDALKKNVNYKLLFYVLRFIVDEMMLTRV